MKEVATIAAPILFGLSEIAPKKNAGKWSILFATIGISAGSLGLIAAHKGEVEKAVLYDVISVLFDALAIKKALDVG